MDQPPLTVRSFENKPSVFSAAAVFVVSLVLGVVVRASYFNATFALDEIYYLEDIGLIRNGRSDLGTYLFTLYGGYLHLLAKLQFYLLWSLFGLNPVAHRVTIALAHAVSATSVFLLLRHYLLKSSSNEVLGKATEHSSEIPSNSSIDGPAMDRTASASVAAWVAALMWASLAVGGYDNPFLWIATGEQALCLMWLLLAMVFVTLCQTHPIISSIGMVFCAACSSLTWGLGLALSPALAVQYYLLEFPYLRHSVARWRWFGLWVGVVGLIALLHLALRALLQEPSSAGAFAWNMPWRFVVQFAVSLGNLIGFSPDQGGSAVALKLVLSSGLLTAALFSGKNARRIVLAFLVGTAGYLAVLVVFRADRDLLDGRYLFVPSLLWCVCIGVVLGGMYQHQGSRGKKTLVAGLILAGFFYLYHQRTVAIAARAEFDQHFTITAETIEGYNLLIDQLEQHAQLSGNVLRLPDFPIVVPPNFFPTYFPFSAWVAVASKDPPSGVELLRADELTLDEVEAAAAFLDSLATPQARQAAQAIRTVVPDTRSLIWLSNFAEQHETIISLPNFSFAYSEMNLSFPVMQCLANAFDQPLPSLRVLPVGQAPAAELKSHLELLNSCGDPQAPPWVTLLSRFAESPPVE